MTTKTKKILNQLNTLYQDLIFSMDPDDYKGIGLGGYIELLEKMEGISHSINEAQRAIQVATVRKQDTSPEPSVTGPEPSLGVFLHQPIEE